MIPALFAQAVEPTSAIGIGVVALALVTLLQLALLGKQVFGGNKGERQIEPTQLAALQFQLDRNHAGVQAELKSQTAMLNEINRESGATKATVDAIAKDVTILRAEHRDEIDKAHQRMNGMSRELASTTARADGLEKREGHA